MAARGQLRHRRLRLARRAVRPLRQQDTYRPDGSNYGKFTDATVAALFRQAIGEPDPTRAADLGNQIDQRLWDQLPSIPLYQLQEFLAWRQDLRNVVNNPTTEGPFWNVGTWAFAKE